MSEHVYYQDQNIVVTNARLVVLGVNYALSNTTSLKRELNSTERNSCRLFCTLLFLVFVGTALAGASILWTVPSLLGAVVILYSSLQIKPIHSIILASKSGETRAVRSDDPSKIEQIMKALTEAIVVRGRAGCGEKQPEAKSSAGALAADRKVLISQLAVVRVGEAPLSAVVTEGCQPLAGG